jgi:hypothetical protein
MQEKMARTAAAQPAPDTVEGSLRFLVPKAEALSVAMPVEGGATPSAGENRNIDRVVPLHNARAAAEAPTLDREGFALTRWDSAMGDFLDADAVRSVYYPEVVAQLKALTGASEVLVFDHTVRVSAEMDREIRIARALREPARVLHCDFTVKSGPQRVRDLLGPEEAEARLAKRVASFNVWRPLSGPVLNWPLVLGDARSIAPNDLVTIELVYGERTGEIYRVTYDPAQRWLYFPAMEADEAVVLKCYDSATDGRARFAPHASFDDPTAPPDAPPRESIELRTLAFFDA